LPVKDSAAKRHKQSEKRRLRNKIVRSRVRTSIRSYLEALKDNSKGEAEVQLKVCTKLLDRAVSKGVFHKNMAARKKHRLYKMLIKAS